MAPIGSPCTEQGLFAEETRSACQRRSRRPSQSLLFTLARIERKSILFPSETERWSERYTGMALP